ncbi:MAG: hypothetical protein ACYC5O_19735 [Anaerolineae bacterium]
MLDIDDLIPLREAAAQLGVTYDEVWQLMRGDVLNGYRCSGQWFVSRREVADYTVAQLQPPGQVPA